MLNESSRRGDAMARKVEEPVQNIAFLKIRTMNLVPQNSKG